MSLAARAARQAEVDQGDSEDYADHAAIELQTSSMIGAASHAPGRMLTNRGARATSAVAIAATVRLSATISRNL